MANYMPSPSAVDETKGNFHSELSMDELDTALCPPALSTYALNILDGKIDRNNLNSSSTTKINHTQTSFTSMHSIKSTPSNNNTKHSKFLTKLGLGAPRRLTNDGDFRPLKKSSFDNLNNNSNHNNHSNNNSQPIDDKSRICSENGLKRESLPTPNSNSRKDSDSNINLDSDLGRKRSLEFTPRKYLHTNKKNNINISDNFINANKENIHPKQESTKSDLLISTTPIKPINHLPIVSPEISRKALIPNTQNINNVTSSNIFETKKTLLLDLNTNSNFNPTSNSHNLKTPIKQSDDSFQHIKNLLDKKKEIYLLKKEIKTYKEELLKQKKQIEDQKLEKSSCLTNESNNLLKIHNHNYKLYEQIGRGGSSKVYRGSLISKPHHYLAIKIVSLADQDSSTVSELKGEIKILHKLRHCSRVVRLLDYSLTNEKIFFVMECGDLDLAKVLSTKHNMKNYYDLEFIRYHAQEMIKCINEIHKLDVVHLDLKPANFVFVSGTLKLIDFGISNSIKGHTVNVYREYQMGTPNYMAPETLLDCAENENGTSFWKVGKPADIWSLGCILYQLTYGTTPYAIYTGTSKILAITNPAININYPIKAINLRKNPQSRNNSSSNNNNNNKENELKTNEGDNDEADDDGSNNIRVCPYLIDMIRRCLIRDPTKRITSDELINNIFINPVVVDHGVINEVVRGCVGFGGRHPELQDIALGKSKDTVDKRNNDRLERLIDGVWKRVGNSKFTDK